MRCGLWYRPTTHSKSVQHCWPTTIACRWYAAPTSYAHTTALGEKYPDRQFCLIMGSDNLASLHRWRNYEYILQNYHILVYPRPGSEHCALRDHPSVTMVDVPMIDISSSYIRRLLAEHRDVRYLLTEPVYKYLTEMHFYQ